MFHLIEYWVIDLNIVSVISVRSSADWLSSGQLTWSYALTTLAEPLRGNDPLIGRGESRHFCPGGRAIQYGKP